MRKIIVRWTDGKWRVTVKPAADNVNTIPRQKKADALRDARAHVNWLRPCRLLVYTRAGKLQSDELQQAVDQPRPFVDDQWENKGW